MVCAPLSSQGRAQPSHPALISRSRWRSVRPAWANWRPLLRKDFDAVMRFWHCPKPTIAAVRGPCLAGAFELALACDMTIASETAFFGEPELKFGAGIVVDYTTLVGWAEDCQGDHLHRRGSPVGADGQRASASSTASCPMQILPMPRWRSPNMSPQSTPGPCGRPSAPSTVRSKRKGCSKPWRVPSISIYRSRVRAHPTRSSSSTLPVPKDERQRLRLARQPFPFTHKANERPPRRPYHGRHLRAMLRASRGLTAPASMQPICAERRGEFPGPCEPSHSRTNPSSLRSATGRPISPAFSVSGSQVRCSPDLRDGRKTHSRCAARQHKDKVAAPRWATRQTLHARPPGTATARGRRADHIHFRQHGSAQGRRDRPCRPVLEAGRTLVLAGGFARPTVC